MAEEISKKELLAETQISYGQLYRWKREGLIPEDWFIKRAVFTGQETFFPRELILERVRAIQGMKDDLSLSDIREQLEASSRLRSLPELLGATTGMSEEFIAKLPINWEQTRLTETSVKALATLWSALEKSAVLPENSDLLITLAIQTLNMQVEPVQDVSEAVPARTSEVVPARTGDAVLASSSEVTLVSPSEANTEPPVNNQQKARSNHG